MAIEIVERADSFRLISDGRGRFAVVEARAGHVYSVHGHHRREAEDCERGMIEVVGEDGWFDEAAARRCLEEASKGGDAYARMIW